MKFHKESGTLGIFKSIRKTVQQPFPRGFPDFSLESSGDYGDLPGNFWNSICLKKFSSSTMIFQKLWGIFFSLCFVMFCIV